MSNHFAGLPVPHLAIRAVVTAIKWQRQETIDHLVAADSLVAKLNDEVVAFDLEVEGSVNE